MFDVVHLPALYDSWRERQLARDERHDIIDRVVAGEFEIYDPDEERLAVSSPNMIQVALEDTAEASSLVPTVRAQPTKDGPQAKHVAQKMERISAGYMEANEIDLLIPRSVMDAGAYGFHVWTVLPDFDQKIPLIERRDPRTCYTEDGFHPGDTVRRALFARELYFSQLPPEWQSKVQATLTEGVMVDTGTEWEEMSVDEIRANDAVVLVEYFDSDEMVLAALYQNSGREMGSETRVHQLPVELKRTPNKVKMCPVVIGARITLDGEFRGQFDQAVGMLEAHIRLFSLLMDYADQAVYSDIFVKDLIGEMPYGGGAYIELGPNGQIGRVPPAVSSLDVQRDLETLSDGIHLGGRWPKSRPGEIDQSIASAKFLESSVGMLNTAIRTYHQILQRSLGKAMRLALATDQAYFPAAKTATGILRNQEFVETYEPGKDIDMSAKVRVEYGLGFGRDPGQSAVLHIQYSQTSPPLISQETVQENVDGIRDVALERSRIDIQQFRGMALAKLLQGIEAGTIPQGALVEIAAARERGDDLFEIFQKYVVEPEEAMRDQALPTGMGGMLGGGPMPSGPPGAPPAAPVPPGGADLMARINMPAGPGGTLGTQVLQEA
jgi:hypothetical protein